MRPDSLLRLWRYINHLLTYLSSNEFQTPENQKMDLVLVSAVLVYRSIRGSASDYLA